MGRKRALVFVCMILCLCPFAVSQTPATGLYEFGSFDNKGFDTINRGNLNVHFSIPIISKTGRGGANFVYALNYDGLIWSPVSSSGTQAWTPSYEWGWTDTTNAEFGYITYVLKQFSCTLNRIQGFYFQESQFKYHDKDGKIHPFPMVYTSACLGSSSPSGTGTYATSDNSGYTIYRTDSTYIVFSKYGAQSAVNSYMSLTGNSPNGSASGAGIYTDTNGNEISATSSGVFTDTTGQTVLTMSGGSYTYTDSNGNAQNVTVNYTSYTVQTNFGVSGITEYNQSSVPLVSSIVYPDGSSYAFTYEPTPGNPSATTGRIASITLRTGGTISYAYSGGSNGIESDGTTAGLTRTTSDGSTTIYTRSGVTSTNSTTQIVDGMGNNGTYTFLENSAGYIYENAHSLYNGSATGTPVEQTYISYNGCVVTCTNPSYVNGGIGSLEIETSRDGTSFEDDTQTFTGPELLASDTGPTGIATNYGYQSFTGPYGIIFYRLSSQSNGQSSATYNYDETTPTTTSGLPQHVSVTTSRGNLTSVHQLVSGTTTITTQTLTYDDAGQVLSAQDGNGNTTTYGHDATDTFVTLVTRPPANSVNHDSSATYDINSGLMTSSTDENNQTTSYTYDSMKRPSMINYPDGGKTTYSYTPTSATQEVLGSGTTTLNTTVDVDGYGRASHVDYPNGSVVDASYDADGRVACVSNPHGSSGSPTDGTTCYSYDVLNRVLTVTDPDGSKKTIAYSGLTTTITDEAGHQRQVLTDGLGRATTVTEPDASGSLSWNTVYSYDLLNQVTQIQQQGGSTNSALWRTRTFTYDAMGRLTSQTTPEAGTTTFGYDNSSNLTSRIDARGITTTYGYDALNRMTSKISSDGSINYSYLYDASGSGASIGRLTHASNDVNAAYNAYYDVMGRVVKQTQCIPSDCSYDVTIQATYDLAGNMTSLTYPDGRVVAQAYNQGQLASVSYSSWNGQTVNSAYVASASYGPPGNVTAETLGNGVQMLAGYNSRLSLQSLQYQTASSQTLWSKQYSWAANAKDLLQIADNLNSAQTYNYTYDPDDRILSASASGVAESYTIDPWGNLQQSGNFNFVQSFGANNQIATSGYSYDAAGDLVADGVGNTYQYNADGMLTASSGAQYVYDALNQRVEKTVGSVATEYVYFQGRVLAELNPGSAAWTDMIYAGGAMIAEVAGNQTAVPEYRLLDHLGSLAMTTDNSGNVTGANVFLPFGQLMSSTTNDAFQFTGLEQDTENSSDHAWFRNLSTEQSRWLRPDPYNGSYDLLNPQSFNRYSYVTNNPLMFVDPSGLEMVTTCDASGNCVTMDDGTGEGGGGGGGGYSCGDNCTGVIAGSPPTIDPGTVSLGDLLPPDSPSSPPSSPPSPGIGPTPTGSTGGGTIARNAPNKNPQPPQPKQPQHFWQKPGCGPSLGILGVGTAGTVLTAGAVVVAFIVGPEELVGFEGATTVIHVAPVGVPGVLIMGQGATGVVQNCF